MGELSASSLRCCSHRSPRVRTVGRTTRRPAPSPRSLRSHRRSPSRSRGRADRSRSTNAPNDRVALADRNRGALRDRRGRPGHRRRRPVQLPRGGAATDLSGFEPNVEAIAGYEPDLVVFATDPGDLGSSLEGLGIPALQLDAAADARRHVRADRAARRSRPATPTRPARWSTTCEADIDELVDVAPTRRPGRPTTTSSTTRSTRSRPRRSSGAVRAARAREHRRRGRQGRRRVPAAVGRVHRRSPTPT